MCALLLLPRCSINSATTKIASAVGGLIYIRVPANRNLGTLNVDVSGERGGGMRGGLG